MAKNEEWKTLARGPVLIENEAGEEIVMQRMPEGDLNRDGWVTVYHVQQNIKDRDLFRIAESTSRLSTEKGVEFDPLKFHEPIRCALTPEEMDFLDRADGGEFYTKKALAQAEQEARSSLAQLDASRKAAPQLIQ